MGGSEDRSWPWGARARCPDVPLRVSRMLPKEGRFSREYRLLTAVGGSAGVNAAAELASAACAGAKVMDGAQATWC